MHILGAIAEFERERIRERVLAGLQRARAARHTIGRPRKLPATIDVPGGSVRAAAELGVCRNQRPRVGSRRADRPRDKPSQSRDDFRRFSFGSVLL